MRFFNTAGPVDCQRHYCLPPLERINLPQVLRLIDQQKYFVLHAPRQTGKTSALLALMKHLNAQGRYRCVYTNVEAAQAARENVAEAMRAILSGLGSRARITLNDTFLDDCWDEILPKYGPFEALTETLTRWSAYDPKPLILLIDEIDSLVGDTLISVLRQLRSGYDQRPHHFPHSIILCGVRDVRDYRIHSDREKAVITGGSVFNIKAAPLRLGDFSRADVEHLYRQHTEETGQIIIPEALGRIWELTEGQPWLVNALGYETCFELTTDGDQSQPVTVELVEQAKENLILRRETHLDQLADKLDEERVQRVIETLLAGQNELAGVPVDDISYVQDRGLIRLEGKIRIANPIYREVIDLWRM